MGWKREEPDQIANMGQSGLGIIHRSYSIRLKYQRPGGKSHEDSAFALCNHIVKRLRTDTVCSKSVGIVQWDFFRMNMVRN